MLFAEHLDPACPVQQPDEKIKEGRNDGKLQPKLPMVFLG